jgi:acyl CoA:acetate/3-ketoacid CoA transferase alpha subunit
VRCPYTKLVGLPRLDESVVTLDRLLHDVALAVEHLGVAGIPAFYTPAAFGTVVQTGAVPLRHNADGTVAKCRRGTAPVCTTVPKAAGV